MCLHRSHDSLNATGRCYLDAHAVVVACKLRQRLTRRLLHGLLVAKCAHGLDERGGIALRFEGLEPRDSGTCLGSRLSNAPTSESESQCVCAHGLVSTVASDTWFSLDACPSPLRSVCVLGLVYLVSTFSI